MNSLILISTPKPEAFNQFFLVSPIAPKSPSQIPYPTVLKALGMEIIVDLLRQTRANSRNFGQLLGSR